MSKLLIQKYLNDLSDLKKASGAHRESVVSEAFKTLLKDWGKSAGLLFIPQYERPTAQGERRYMDGALVEPQLRMPFGYWEAKDTDDDLDKEIAKKFRAGYPQDNIIFEDSETAVLIQNKREVLRCAVDDAEKIERLVGQFFNYQPEVVREFRKAVEQFKEDLPAVLETLRKAIERAEAENPAFKKAAIKFLKHAQETINPSVTAADVREMLIQHILTEEIFSQVFGDSDFHHKNNVAKELYALEETFFTGNVKRQTLDRLKPYYTAIKSNAELVPSHQEKQKFLKLIYENFYKVYNKKAADRLGVAYTPNEIVQFMIESADWLCQKNFGKKLIDKNVEILDPAAGTGTFIVDLLEHFRGQKEKLKYKYENELHANEVAILPYYVANLNIEATYSVITGEYLEYPSLCFVDTLDNVAGLRTHGVGKGQHFGDLLGSVSEENVARIKRQNARKISVIIGNPPYNANQLNENENNKNREYPAIDRRIKETYIAASTAQKTKRYDMYSRFFRWASDRIEENGIVTFISNRNFIDAREADGFRATVAKEFDSIYVVDLGGDWKSKGAAGGGNVFGIGTGVAISFLVKRSSNSKGRILYTNLPAEFSGDEKLSILANTSLKAMSLAAIEPDKMHNWIDLSPDLGALLILGDKQTKLSKRDINDRAIFKLYSLGVVTNRDEWVYDFNRPDLVRKVIKFIDHYNEIATTPAKSKSATFDTGIKWTRAVKREALQGVKYEYSDKVIRPCLFRPFVSKYLYFDRHLNEMQYQLPSIFSKNVSSPSILVSSGKRGDFKCLATSIVPSLDVFLPDACEVFPRRRLDTSGGTVDNITDWALEQFRAQYEKDKKPKRAITKDAIFHYVYGVLHDPVYREKYALNLKREFPRIPFYADFWKWADWGEKLMALHIGYERVDPWPLKRVDTVDKTAKKSGVAPKTMLKALKDTGAIVLDSDTQLSGIPDEAWDYRLGNRSALEWILDQYKEKTPKDPTIREKFNTYRFANYKDHVIDLLKRVTRVSVETMKVIEEMKAAKNAR